MQKQARGIKFPSWLDAAIEKVAADTGTSFTDVVVRTMELAMNARGHYSPLDRALRAEGTSDQSPESPRHVAGNGK